MTRTPRRAEASLRRLIYGLTFTIHSPSLYQLAVIDDVGDPGARVTLEFTGLKWRLCYQYGNGHCVYRVFPSRDAAISLIADRRASA